MPIKQPRLSVVIEPRIYEAIKRLAKKEGLSLSMAARDLLKEALVIYEDAFWAREAKARETSLKRRKVLSLGIKSINPVFGDSRLF